jgi:hypothetical protein
MIDPSTLPTTLPSDASTYAPVVAFVLAAVVAAQKYRRDGRLPLSDLPWKATRRLIYTARRRIPLFDRPWPEAVSRRTELTVGRIRRTIGPQGYNPAFFLSYEYQGEDLNARRYYFDPTRDYPHRQMHVRARQAEDGADVHAHEEPAPEHHPRAHIEERGKRPATEWVVDRLEADQPLDPREFAP